MRLLFVVFSLSFCLLFSSGPPSAAQEPTEEDNTHAFLDAYQADDLERAARLAEDSLESGNLTRNDRGKAHQVIAEYYISIDEMAAARGALDTALGLLDEPAKAHYERFKLAFTAQDWNTAAHDLTALAKLRPDLARPVNLSAIQTIQASVAKMGESELAFEMLIALRDARYSGAPADTRPDPLYKDLALMLATRGRRFEAEALINLIYEPDLIIHMMMDKRYSALWSALDLQFATYASITARELEFLGKARQRLPNSLKLVRQYIQDLRRHGLSAQAAQLGSAVIKQIQDAGQSILTNRHAPWVANELAYALLDLGQNDEAITLLGQLARLETSQNPELINQKINYAAILLWSERYVSALDAVPKSDSEHLSSYGQAFAHQISVCAYNAMERHAEVDEALAHLLADPFTNPQATQIALLCLDRHDDGVNHFLKRLENEDTRESALHALAMKDLGHIRSPFFRTLYERFDEIRQDERVKASLDSIGRALPFDVRPIYWAAF